MPRTRIDNPELRKKMILMAAEAALAEKGYHNVLLEDVARHANVSKGTIYLYFQDKDELMSDLFESISREFGTRAAGLQGLDDLPPLEQLKRVMQEMVAMLGEHRDFFAQFSLQKPQIYGKKVGEALKGHYEKHLRFLAGKIQACIDAGVFRPHDPFLGALFLTCILRMMLVKEILEGEAGKVVQAEHVLEFFLKGVGK